MSSPPPKTVETELEQPEAPKPTMAKPDVAVADNVEAQTPVAPAPAPAPTDPKVLELVAMFPTIDVPVIELVLETSGGSVDRAIETLLGMTDPDFKPDELGNARVREEDSQLDMDAEFARKLQLEDDEAAASQARGQQPQQQHYGYGDQQLPYQPRVSQRGFNPSQQQQSRQNSQQSQHSQQQQQQGSDLPPGMLMVEEKLGQFVETGKRTFDSFLTKAKQKYSEYQAVGAAPGMTPVDSTWGLENKSQDTSRQQQSQQQQGGLWGPTRSLSQRNDSVSSASTSDSHLANPQPQQQAAPKRWQPSDTFEDDTSPVPRSYSFSNSPSRSPPPVDGAAKGKIDVSKLGLLPKKRVDLLSTSPQAEPRQPSAHTKIPATPPGKNKVVDESDDDLEYTKNPFDER